jgi:hypothetical protein
VPDYLEGRLFIADNEDPCNYDLNKHEQLFGPCKNCKEYKLVVLQLCSTGVLVCLSWSLICFIGYSVTALLSASHDYSLLLAPLAHLLIVAACFSVYSSVPLTTYCLVTNTEMMKDRKAV